MQLSDGADEAWDEVVGVVVADRRLHDLVLLLQLGVSRLQLHVLVSQQTQVSLQLRHLWSAKRYPIFTINRVFISRCRPRKLYIHRPQVIWSRQPAIVWIRLDFHKQSSFFRRTNRLHNRFIRTPFLKLPHMDGGTREWSSHQSIRDIDQIFLMSIVNTVLCRRF